MTEETPLWLVRHVEKELGTRFVNARQVQKGMRKAWLVNTSNGAVLATRRAGGEPHLELLAFPDQRQALTCTVCEWHMEFVGADFPLRAYCSNCGTLHERWADGTLSRIGEPQVIMPSEVLADAPPTAPTPPAARAKKAKSAPAKNGNAPYTDFKGDVDAVLDVEGIGPVFAGRLEKAGILTTARLCYETPQTIAKIADVPLKTAKTWQANAELMKVSGIGKQYAEAMARAGVTGIDELKRAKPAALAEKVNAYLAGLEVNVLGNSITARRVEGWQKKAAPMRRVRQKIPAQ